MRDSSRWGIVENMSRIQQWAGRQRVSVSLAVQALRAWGSRQIATAVVAAVAVGVVVGVATVLIPNPVFGREIPPVPWNYPVWIVTSVLTGMLIATYVRPAETEADGVDEMRADRVNVSEKRSARVGGAAGVLAWFAVGCPVCNKIALLALGYTGALTWFAPLQPVLAVAALALSVVAVLWRLRGQMACPMPVTREAVAR